MMNLAYILKQALKDPSLHIDVLIPPVYESVRSAIRDLPKDTLVSEWKHTLGEARYEYHIHYGTSGAVLKLLHARGVCGGNPKLVQIYTKKDLDKLTQEVPTA